MSLDPKIEDVPTNEMIGPIISIQKTSMRLRLRACNMYDVHNAYDESE